MGVGFEEEGARVGARRPASPGIPAVRIEGRGGRPAAACCASGVRRAPRARILVGLLSLPPRAGFVLFRGSGGSRRILGDAQAEVGPAQNLLGFVVPPVPGGSACPVWRGGSGASAALPGECWEEDVGVAGAGWARRCEAGGR